MDKNKMERIYKKIRAEKIFLFVIMFLVLILPSAMAEAIFSVSDFSCSPSEVVISSVFSCTATITNTGGDAGSVSTATLFVDVNDWLEQSTYEQASGVSVNPGTSTSVTFTGLRAVKSGNNGFQKIMLDSVTNTYVADQNKKVNVINVAVTLSNSASSAAMGGTITTTSEVTAGGNIDISLTFTANSGGCSIGSQTNPKAISGMTDGAKQSRTWTITQGTSGDCEFTISAAATGSGGVASKIDSTSSTIDCTNCPTGGGTTSSSGGGGGGAGAGGTNKTGKVVGEGGEEKPTPEGGKPGEKGAGEKIKELFKGKTKILYILAVIFILLAIASGIAYYVLRAKKNTWRVK